MGYDYLIWIWIIVFGACIGSFLNVVIARLPKGEFFSKVRSYCPDCGKTIRWFDLFPVISWLALKGRCRDCKARIPVRLPFVEAAGALLAAGCFWLYGFDIRSALAFGVVMILLAVSLIDLDTTEIPDSLIIALIPFAAVAVWGWQEIALTERVIGFFAISLPMLLISLVISGAFGGGDIKLIAVCGFLLGWQNALLAFFIALLLGGGYAIFLMASRRRGRKEHMVFGPALCAGIAIALIFGNEIIDFYIHLFI